MGGFNVVTFITVRNSIVAATLFLLCFCINYPCSFTSQVHSRILILYVTVQNLLIPEAQMLSMLVQCPNTLPNISWYVKMLRVTAGNATSSYTWSVWCLALLTTSLVVVALVANIVIFVNEWFRLCSLFLFGIIFVWTFHITKVYYHHF